MQGARDLRLLPQRHPEDRADDRSPRDFTNNGSYSELLQLYAQADGI
jgi:hypothetical protein